MPLFSKTVASLTLLLTLTACGTFATKDKSDIRKSQGLLTPSSATDPLNIRTEADYQFIKGDLLSREGQSAQAAEVFEKVKALDPSSPTVYLRLSEEYKKLNRLSEAISNAEIAVQKNPKNIDARFFLGEMYNSQKSFDKALAQYNAILKIQPNNTDATIYLGSVYATMKDFKTAEQYFKSVLKNPHYETPYLVHYYLGLMHSDQPGAKFQLASENEFKKSLMLNPGFEDALVSLSNLYVKQNHRDRALALCSDFIKRQGFNAKVADMIAQFHIDNGDLEKAYSQLSYIAENSNNSVDAEVKMAFILIKTKRFELAVTKLNNALKKSPEADSARYYLAAVYEESGEKSEAVKNYLMVPQSSEHFTDAVSHAAYLLKSQGKMDQALELISKGIKAKAEPQLYIMQASILDAKSDYTSASRTLEEGLKKYTKNTELMFQHAIMLDRLGKKDSMLQQMNKVLEIEPDHVQSLSYLAFSLAELNQKLSEAEKMARRASELSPEDGYVLDTLGWVLFKQKKYSESIKVLEKAYAIQPNASIIAEHLADAYSMESQTEKAKEMYKKAASLTTDEIRSTKIRNKMLNPRS